MIKKDDPEEAYADETPLTWVFGDHPKVRLIAALLSEKDRDINVQDLSRMSGLSRDAVYTHLDHLVTNGIVVQTRKLGNSPMYQINKEHNAVPLIWEIEQILLDNWYESQRGNSSI